jgi:hypothetical protein
MTNSEIVCEDLKKVPTSILTAKEKRWVDDALAQYARYGKKANINHYRELVKISETIYTK